MELAMAKTVPDIRRKPRNKEIKFRIVRLVNPETGQLDPFTELSDIIAKIDHKREWVELVTEKPEPVVKIIKDKDVYRKQQALEDRKRERRQREEKEVQLTWGITPGDEEHKLQKVREELERGNRINLVYASKKGQDQLTADQMHARAQHAVDSLADVGVEWKERSVAKLTTIIYLQGRNLPPPLNTRSPKAPQKNLTRPRNSPSDP